MFFNRYHYYRLNGYEWKVIEFPLAEGFYLRIVVSPNDDMSWHVTGPCGFKSIDLLSFAPENTTAVVSPFFSSSVAWMQKDGCNKIYLEDFHEPLWIVWILFHEIGHVWSHRNGKRKGKLNPQEERDAWAYSFRMLRKLSRVCGVRLLTREGKRSFLQEMYSFDWAQLPHKGKTVRYEPSP